MDFDGVKTGVSCESDWCTLFWVCEKYHIKYYHFYIYSYYYIDISKRVFFFIIEILLNSLQRPPALSTLP